MRPLGLKTFRQASLQKARLLGRMKHKLRCSCTAFAFLIVLELSAIPLTTNAQTLGFSRFPPVPDSTVSLRALQIPPRARNAYRSGLEHLYKGDLKGSLPYFDKALQSFPGFYEACHAQGVVEMELNLDDQALHSFQRAIDLSGGRFVWASFGYAFVLVKQGKSKEAEAILRSGLEQDSTIGAGHLLLSIVLFNLSRLDAAESSAHEALSRPGQASSGAYLVLADIHAERRDYQAQVEDLETYLKLRPLDPNRQFILAVLGNARRLAASDMAKKLPE